MLPTANRFNSDNRPRGGCDFRLNARRVTGSNSPSGDYPAAAAVQDFNNDGISDIASANEVNKMYAASSWGTRTALSIRRTRSLSARAQSKSRAVISTATATRISSSRMGSSPLMSCLEMATALLVPLRESRCITIRSESRSPSSTATASLTLPSRILDPENDS